MRAVLPDDLRERGRLHSRSDEPEDDKWYRSPLGYPHTQKPPPLPEALVEESEQLPGEVGPELLTERPLREGRELWLQPPLLLSQSWELQQPRLSEPPPPGNPELELQLWVEEGSSGVYQPTVHSHPLRPPCPALPLLRPA